MLTEMAKLRHQIDIGASLISASLHDNRPEVIEMRGRLVDSINHGRKELERLKRLDREGWKP
jgi:hypothetical protein